MPTEWINRLGKTSSTWFLKVAGKEDAAEDLPDTVTMKLDWPEVGGDEAVEVEWNSKNVSSCPLTPRLDLKSDQTHRSVASASRHGQSRKCPTRALTVPDSRPSTSLEGSTPLWWLERDP